MTTGLQIDVRRGSLRKFEEVLLIHMVDAIRVDDT